jgi:hypothetical protein
LRWVVVAYRGEYDHSEQYRPGDICTCAGSLFVALKDNPVDAPGVCPEWAPVAPRLWARPFRPRS